jgi:predicted helicase
MTALTHLLDTFRQAAVSEREKGTYFEELIICYLRNEPAYQDEYSNVWTYKDWAALQGLDGRDTGIDLVAQTAGTNEFHAIQCKFYAENYRVTKGDLDSFFTASGKKPFTQRVIVTTTNNWNEHANDALQNQQPPCIKIDLAALEQSQIDWSAYQPKTPVKLKPKKQLRDHQIRARAAVMQGLEQAERGKLIMACGTGKTFTSLKIAESRAGAGKRVLFLVPSLSLLSQTLTEWTQESDVPLHSFAVCSDHDVGKKRKKDDDIVQTFAHELNFPATTDPKKLLLAMTAKHDATHMTVVFSTYHSIEVIHEAQKQGLPAFDLIICDEAHRTTGATFEDDDESAFVRIHDQNYVRGDRRLYMTATPRIYGEAAKATADSAGAELCSMDDEAMFGKELFVITFNEAVRAGLLVDYKVIVLAMDEAHVNRRVQQLLSDGDNNVKVEDAAKIIGCWKALSKQDTQDSLMDDHDPMRRAVAFCQVIEHQSGGKTHKISSKKIAGMFAQVVEAYKASAPDDEPAAKLRCEASHIDGSMTASEKEAQLNWLKADIAEDTCRILSNVRCLSEGVDVPSLDAVLFLTPRNSQVDVVQSVGRVMRKDPANRKKRGYVVLPVVIPAGMEPDEALNDNKTYKVVWQVLQALRSHDDRFDAMINKMDLVGADKNRMEVIAVSDKLARKSGKKGAGGVNEGKKDYLAKSPSKKKTPSDADKQQPLEFQIGEIERAIYAKVVQKCGNRMYWEQWADDIGRIAQTHITRIQTILENPANTAERAAFDAFAAELRDDLNQTISDVDIVEMLAQHLITKPVFDALFADYSFASNNPMSLAMQDVLNALQEHHLDKETDTLQKFYDSVKVRAEGIDSAGGKQKIVVELYDKFFSKAFPRMREKLGIVYTPVEVVDFIIHSVNDVLQSEFGQTLGSDGVHIIDPFTGTGTFITRLLQSGLITTDQIRKKYKNEIHANEIVLLAYYIAAINIESVYHGLVGGDYVPFEGICLTDTFQMYEKEDLVDALLEQNSARRKRQKALDIRVIIGNPPYSIGQKSENDNNDNVEYPNLDHRIRSTYAARSNATLAKGLYDSYIRAIRWASDRIGESGVIGFVTNAGFLEAYTADGLRKCLAEEFSSIYVFHLRGNQRTVGEVSRREGGKIFGGGSRSPIAISLFIKNPNAEKHGQIYYHDIGDYLSREEKLDRIQSLGSISGIKAAQGWLSLKPDEHGDWLRQRDGSFSAFMAMGDKKGDAPKLFDNFSMGVATNRDAWCYNFSQVSVSENLERMIEFYNAELQRLKNAHPILDKKDRERIVNAFVNTDSKRISWTHNLKQELAKGRSIAFESACLTPSLYRPFTKQWLYFNRTLNERVFQMPKIFPDSTSGNRAIMVKQRWAGEGQLALMIDQVVELQTDGGAQCFPLYLYEIEGPPESDDSQGGLFSQVNGGGNQAVRRDAITDEGLAHFLTAYPGAAIGKEDIFYYVYGMLHSQEYRDRYADNLNKELPRIPRVKAIADFWAFSKAGRALADLHVNFESVPLYPAKVIGGSQPEDYRVEKMRYGKEKDKSTLIYNSKITVTGIPLAAYEYVVNGKPALDWVVERQCVKTEKDSGIVNDANDWANETMSNPKYPLELFLRMITVSLETMKIVRSLPPLDLVDQA